MIFFNFFYTCSGILTISVGLLYQLESTRPLLVTSLPNAVAMMLILIGAVISLLMFVSHSVFTIKVKEVVMVMYAALSLQWIGLGVWPLFSLERRRYRGYTELQEN